MSIRGDVIRYGVWRGRLSRLLLALLVVRALIPVGFMPDFSQGVSGIFKVVICTAYGSKTISLDANGKTAPGEQAQHHDQPCAFSGLFGVTLTAPEVAALVRHVAQDLPNLAPLAVVLPPSRAGPQLGSRGPPHLS